MSSFVSRPYWHAQIFLRLAFYLMDSISISSYCNRKNEKNKFILFLEEGREEDFMSIIGIWAAIRHYPKSLVWMALDDTIESCTTVKWAGYYLGIRRSWRIISKCLDESYPTKILENDKRRTETRSLFLLLGITVSWILYSIKSKEICLLH